MFHMGIIYIQHFIGLIMKYQDQLKPAETTGSKTLGLVYITKETLQKGESLPFENRNDYNFSIRPIDWSERVGQVYYKLSYCPNYPSLDTSHDLLFIRSATDSEIVNFNLPRVGPPIDFGENGDELYLTLEKSFFEWFPRRREFKGALLELLSVNLREFNDEIPGRGGHSWLVPRLIPTSKGALGYKRDFYDELVEIYIDQHRIPFAGLRRKVVGIEEGDQFNESMPIFDFRVLEYDGKEFGEELDKLGFGFHFRENRRVKTLSWGDIKSYLESKTHWRPRNFHLIDLIRMPGYENRGIVLRDDGKSYELDMETSRESIGIVDLRELPFQKVIKISPVSSSKINETLLEWATNPEISPYRCRHGWICRTRPEY